MATTPEGRVKASVVKLIKAYRAYYHMPHMNGMGSSGVADFAVCYHGRYLAIEAKADESGAPTELQWVRLREVEKAGGDTMVIHAGNLAVLENWLKNPTAIHVVREMDSRRVLGHSVNGVVV